MSSPTSAAEGSRPAWPTVVVVCAALFVGVAPGPAIGIALPTIATDLGAGQAELTGISSVSAVVSAGTLLTLAAAADRFGRRSFLLGGLLLLAVAEMGTSLAGSPAPVLGLRALAGLATAALLPVSLAVLVEAFPRSRRSTAVALWAATSSAAASVGGLASGTVADVLSWRVTSAGIAVLALLLVVPVALLTPNRRRPGLALDPLGSLLILLGLGTLVLALSGIGQGGPLTLRTGALLVVGLLALLAFLGWQRRARRPLLPVGLMTRRGVRVGSLFLLLVTGGFAAYTLLLPQYLQLVLELSTLQSSVVLLLGDVTLVVISPLLPLLLRRAGARWVGAGGAATLAAGFALLAVVARQQSLWPVLAALVVVGAGVALSLTPGTSLLIGSLPQDRLSTASALTYVNRDVGAAVGASLVGGVLLAVYQLRIAAAVADLPAAQAEQVRGGITSTLAAVEELGPDAEPVLAAAREAFLAGFQTAALTAAALALLAAVLAALLAPSGLTEARGSEDAVGDDDPDPTRLGADDAGTSRSLASTTRSDRNREDHS